MWCGGGSGVVVGCGVAVGYGVVVGCGVAVGVVWWWFMLR